MLPFFFFLLHNEFHLLPIVTANRALEDDNAITWQEQRSRSNNWEVASEEASLSWVRLLCGGCLGAIKVHEWGLDSILTGVVAVNKSNYIKQDILKTPTCCWMPACLVEMHLKGKLWKLLFKKLHSVIQLDLTRVTLHPNPYRPDYRWSLDPVVWKPAFTLCSRCDSLPELMTTEYQSALLCPWDTEWETTDLELHWTHCLELTRDKWPQLS